MTGNHDWLPTRYTVYPRKCACARRTADPQVVRIAPAQTVGIVSGWVKQPHCSTPCRVVHLIHQYHEQGHWYARHMGLYTLREADDFINIRPDGPTSEDIRKAYGA